MKTLEDTRSNIHELMVKFGLVKEKPKHILGPDGVPAIYHQLADLNRQNRERIYAKVKGWDIQFGRGSQLMLRGIVFQVSTVECDLLCLDAANCITKDKGWYHNFSIGEVVSIYNVDFSVIDLGFDQLHLKAIKVRK